MDPQEAKQSLEEAVDTLGPELVSEWMGWSTSDLDAFLSVEGVDLDGEQEQRLRLTLGVVAKARHVVGVDLGDDELEEVSGISSASEEEAGLAELGLAGEDLRAPYARGTSEKVKNVLMVIYVETMRRQMDMSLSERAVLEQMGLMLQIELALIMYFGESVPETGQHWDTERRTREMLLRVKRLRWVQAKQAEEFKGLRGVMAWVFGSKPKTGKELFALMLKEVDEMRSMGLRKGDGSPLGLVQDVVDELGLGAPGEMVSTR